MKVFILGLDGATFDLIGPWAGKGRLPAFRRLMSGGAWGRLDSVPNMRSAAAWTSFMTGTNPGKHGIFEFYEHRHDYRLTFLHGGNREGRSLWKILSEAGKRVAVVNVPMTYPAEAVNGFLIAGLDAPGPGSERFTHPSGIIRDIEEKLGTYVLEPGLTSLLVDGRLDEARSRLMEELEQKIALCRHYLRGAEWDFFTMVFRSLDAAQHCFWKYMDAAHPQHEAEAAEKYGDVIFDYYQRIDGLIPDIEESLGEDGILLVMSDHGCGAKHRANNQINTWLCEQGYLRFRPQRGEGFAGRLYHLVQKKTSRKLKERLVRAFPALRNRVQSKVCFDRIDWPHTRAYSDGLFSHLSLNLRGREPQGTVEPGPEADSLRRELKKRLMRCRDAATGEKIVSGVFEKSEIYHGPHVNRAPDLLVRWREDIQLQGIALERTVVESEAPLMAEDHRVISGDHRFQGVFLASGPRISQGKEVGGAGIMDLAPTVLHAFGLPVPREMDGRILRQIFTEEAWREPCFEEDKGDAPKDELHYSSDDEDLVRERLKGLGYLD